MSAPGTEPQGVPPQGQVPQGFPQPFGPPAHIPPSYGPPRRQWGALITGLALGLVVGAGGLGLAWALSSDDSGTDYDAVCGLITRTEPLSKEFELGDMQRLGGVSQLAAALAEDDPTHKPLAEALDESVRAAQMFDLDQSSTSLRQAQAICGA